AFVVVLSRRADVNLAVRWVLDEEVQVVHLIYPLLAMEPAEFERFGNAVHQGVAASERGGPVHATFHPAMVGDPSAPARLVGFLRRAPDPFIQFIPEGLHEGGSTFIDLESVDLRELVKNAPPPKGANSQSIFERLAARDIETIRATIADIHRDRADSYAEFL